ncbi:MAG: chromosomal replication initiator protein DnaA [Deltaproteobacteria bacterium]|nr:chromosomal replication initiator protein DnaA [Deltaproteobacteria bacterium]
MNTVWESVKDAMRAKLPGKSFSLWIKPITLLEQKEDTLLLGCPNKFSLNWVAENYLPLLEQGLQESAKGRYRLHLKVKPVERSLPPSPFPDERQLALPNIPLTPRRGWRSLNNEFTFDRFVVGKCNEFAYSASKALAQDDQFSCNPLFILAKTGLGKSHLSQAVGHALLKNKPELRVYYITTEDFVNEMISALKSHTIEEFKNKYRRTCDALLLEEVHFLSGKEKTQLELGYTLDALANDHKKIVFTSSLLPKDMPNLTRELSSRLTSGIITSLEKPEYDTRVKILEKKAAEQRLRLSEEIIHLLAGKLTGDIRQMESSLRCLKAKSELMKARLDMDLVKEVVQSHISDQGCITMEDIRALVCQYFKVDPSLLQSKSRKALHAYPRNVYVYLCRRHTAVTVEEIGRSINRNHSTVLYACEVMERKLKTDLKVKNQVDFLLQKLKHMSN